MAIADSDNLLHQRAFKTGYQFGVNNKPLSHMPNAFRYDTQLRDYFMQGWETAQAEQAKQQELLNQPNWRYRIIWFVIMVAGGLATAWLMLHNIEQEKAQQAAQTTVQSDSSLRLLSAQQRQDFAANQAELQKALPSKTSLSPLAANKNLQILEASLLNNGQNFALKPFSQAVKGVNIPKHLRKLEFLAQVRLNNAQKIFLVWSYRGLEVQKEVWDLRAGNSEIISQLTMSSARQGTWYLELKDQDGQVFQRMTFNYGHLNAHH